MAWQDVELTPADRMIQGLELYRQSDLVVRECVQAELLGLETPESYDRLERMALKNGEHSYEERKLDGVRKTVDAILRSLRSGRE